MKKKSIFVCQICFSRNYNFFLNTNRSNTLCLKKYCSNCKTTSKHSESK